MSRGNDPVNGEGTFGGLSIRELFAGLAMAGLLAELAGRSEGGE